MGHTAFAWLIQSPYFLGTDIFLWVFWFILGFFLLSVLLLLGFFCVCLFVCVGGFFLLLFLLLFLLFGVFCESLMGFSVC